MNYAVEIHPHAARQLDKIPAETYSRIYPALDRLGENPRPMGCQKLKGPIHRIRVGGWRVFYAIFDESRIVTILEVVRRSERTYRHI